MLCITALAKTTLVFRKNLIKIFIHLVIHTSFIDPTEGRKDANWKIILSIWLVFFMFWWNICCFYVWGEIRTEQWVIKNVVYKVEKKSLFTIINFTELSFFIQLIHFLWKFWFKLTKSKEEDISFFSYIVFSFWNTRVILK